MPQYLTPGVYIEEVPGAKPISGVGTATGAFIGIAEKGPIGQAELVTNWTQFVNKFGTYLKDYYLAYSVRQFFSEGGTKCYIVRTCHYDGDAPQASKAETVLVDDGNAGTLKVFAASPGSWGKKIKLSIAHDTDDPTLFHLSVFYDVEDSEITNEEKEPKEIFKNLSMDEDSESYVEYQVDGVSMYITFELPLDSTKNLPKEGIYALSTEGEDGISGLIDSDFIDNGLYAFDTVDDINIVAIPDRQNYNIIKNATSYCQNRQDCFFVADPPEGQLPSGTGDGSIRKFKQGLTSPYGALYYPWIVIIDPVTGKRKEIPPSGAIIGTYSATDVKRGVHKAPAGVIDGYLNTAVDVECIVTKGEQEPLNDEGINVIRNFPTAGIVIWGARTLATKIDAENRYVNVRRLLMYIEESLEEGTQWVVFEPNSPSLWATVKRDITNFLTIVWRDGALFGLTPEEAFFVKVDAENNPPETRDLGRLYIDVGVAPVKPAEFVIIRISQKTLEA